MRVHGNAVFKAFHRRLLSSVFNLQKLFFGIRFTYQFYSKNIYATDFYKAPGASQPYVVVSYMLSEWLPIPES